MINRSILLTLSFVINVMMSLSQAPESFKYQAVARDASGFTVNNSPVSLRLSILDGTTTGPVVFQESHAVTTNEFGLFSISVGTGSILAGSFAGIDWPTGDKFLKIEADLSGGTTYTEMGTSQLLSVPYALYAKYAGTAFLPNGTTAGNTAYWDGSQWVLNSSNIFNNGGFIGIGNSLPLQRLDVSGQINIPTDSAYMINNKAILSSKGLKNVFMGENAAAGNTFGQYNVYAGYDAGLMNTVGSQNVFLGVESGSANLDGMMNSFVGRRSGYSNTSGNENTFIGCYAGQNTTVGNHNSFFGVTTGNSNTTGEENTFLGAHAGYFNTTGSNNTYVGNFAGQFSGTGNNNVIIGFGADASSSNLSNAIAIGAGSVVNASNSVIIGNTSITSIGGQVGWSTFSDSRLKTNVTPETLGLNFITRLTPVRYNYLAEGQAEIEYSGLIAQEVEDVLRSLGSDFSGLVKPRSDNDFYSIRYGEFVIPLINAVKEQQVYIEEIQKENEQLKQDIKNLKELEKRIENLEKKK